VPSDSELVCHREICYVVLQEGAAGARAGPGLGGVPRSARRVPPRHDLLAQQVAEKALKTFLYGQGLEIVLGHSVERLCREATRWDSTIAEPGTRWAILDSYYVPTRYPNSIPDNIPARVYTAEAAQGAVALAREVVAWVQAHMTYGMWQSHAERLIGMRTCLSPLRRVVS